MQAGVVLVVGWARLRFQSLQRTLNWASEKAGGGIAAERLAWAVKAASRRVPGATCLVQALALQRMLSQNGYSSDLQIGIDKSEGRFTAHAWLNHDNRILIGGATYESYKLLASWSAHGKPSEGEVQP